MNEIQNVDKKSKQFDNNGFSASFYSSLFPTLMNSMFHCFKFFPMKSSTCLCFTSPSALEQVGPLHAAWL